MNIWCQSFDIEHRWKDEDEIRYNAWTPLTIAFRVGIFESAWIEFWWIWEDFGIWGHCRQLDINSLLNFDINTKNKNLIKHTPFLIGYPPISVSFSQTRRKVGTVGSILIVKVFYDLIRLMDTFSNLRWCNFLHISTLKRHQMWEIDLTPTRNLTLLEFLRYNRGGMREYETTTQEYLQWFHVLEKKMLIAISVVCAYQQATFQLFRL